MPICTGFTATSTDNNSKVQNKKLEVMALTANKKPLHCVAFDCGNASIRVVLGRYDENRIECEVVHQVANPEIEFNGSFYWDILKIYQALETGLKKAYQSCGCIDSAGICTWGVDYGLLASGNQLLGNLLNYRNPLGAKAVEQLSEAERLFIFEKSGGIQCDKINSIYHLLGYREAYPEMFAAAREFLLLPDLLVYLFTGAKGTEATITSTTQLYDVARKQYAPEILQKFALEPELFKPVVPHGKIRGYLKKELSEKLGINRFPFVCVPSHDTASAVAAVPADQEEFLFISSGTWSLIGTELQEPVIDRKTYQSGFTNEAGAFDTITLLKNSIGLFLAQRLRQEAEDGFSDLLWSEITALAAQAGGGTVIDPNRDQFFNPPDMAEEIRRYALKTGQRVPPDTPSLFRTVYESLALSYYDAVLQIEAITGKDYPEIHIVGGGSQNDFLNQLTADITGKTVIAGPVEATSIGNICAQLIYLEPRLSVPRLREIIRESSIIAEYIPSPNLLLRSHYDVYLRLKESLQL